MLFGENARSRLPLLFRRVIPPLAAVFSQSFSEDHFLRPALFFADPPFRALRVAVFLTAFSVALSPLLRVVSWMSPRLLRTPHRVRHFPSCEFPLTSPYDFSVHVIPSSLSPMSQLPCLL